MQDYPDKQNIQTILSAARRYTSKKTQFIQFDETIEIMHQWCFILALCKSKQKEAILEAIAQINRLLFWQNSKGAFPRYLHDYPNAYSNKACLKIFLALSQVISCMKGVLQALTIQPWVSACRRLEGYLDSRLSDPLERFWFSCIQSYQNKEPLCFTSAQEYSFCCAEDWAKHYCFLQAAFLVPKSLITNIQSLYHPVFGYVGPMEKEKEENAKPLFTLLDVFFRPCLKDIEDPKSLSLCLQKALITSVAPGVYTPMKKIKDWLIREYTPEEKTGHYIRIETKDTLHVIGKNTRLFFSEKQCLLKGETRIFPVHVLDPKYPFVSRLFCTYAKEVTILVNNKRSSLFRLGDEISITGKDFCLRLIWKLFSGTGDFTGHILRGTAPQEKTKLPGLDYMIAIRALRYEQESKLQVVMHFV